MSLRETALLALLARITTTVQAQPEWPLPRVPVPEVLRNEQRAPTLKAPGLVCLFDGEAVEETPIISPLSYIIRWRADVEIHVAGETATARAAALDSILVPLCAALADNRTLGGAVEWLDIGAVQLAENENDVSAALLPVEMQWTAVGSPNA
jgi:hypothetical protein